MATGVTAKGQACTALVSMHCNIEKRSPIYTISNQI